MIQIIVEYRLNGTYYAEASSSLEDARKKVKEHLHECSEIRILEVDTEQGIRIRGVYR